ncbi:MAG: hypothetical protein ACOC7U_04450 [Spirochaetota bacterium]
MQKYTPGNICVLVSLKTEVYEFLGILEDIHTGLIGGSSAYKGRLFGTEVRVIRTGPGPEKQRRLQRKALDGCVLGVSAGLCGALQPELETGGIVVTEQVVEVPLGVVEAVEKGRGGDEQKQRSAGPQQSEKQGLFYKGEGRPPDRWDTMPGGGECVRAGGLNIQKAAADLQALGVKVYTGNTLTAPRVVAQPRQKLYLGSLYGALSVDTEDFYRLRLFQSLGVPAVSIRAVLDRAGEPAPSRKTVFSHKHTTAADSALSSCQKNLSLALKNFIFNYLNYLK